MKLVRYFVIIAYDIVTKKCNALRSNIYIIEGWLERSKLSVCSSSKEIGVSICYPASSGLPYSPGGLLVDGQ